MKDVAEAFCIFNWSPLAVFLSFMGTSDLFCESEFIFVLTAERESHLNCKALLAE